MIESIGFRIDGVLDRARDAGRRVLLETDALELAEAIGFRTPRRLVLADAAAVDAESLASLGSAHVAVKVLAGDVRHKTEQGGVVRCAAVVADVRAALREMATRFSGHDPSGFCVQAWIEHDSGPAGELLVSLRQTDDFGPVVTLGPGGVWAETLAAGWREGRAVSILSPLTPRHRVPAILDRLDLTALLTEPQRGVAARVPRASFHSLVENLLTAAPPLLERCAELELNPLVAGPDGWIALDALATPHESATRATPLGPSRPVEAMQRMLVPERIAIVGVSRGMNPGRVILENSLRAGFPPERIAIIKSGAEQVAGCRCYPGPEALPWPVDLVVLAVAADRIPAQIDSWIATRRARSLIVIPGGLGERAGSEVHAQRIAHSIEAAREQPWGGPLVNGGNCLGIRSRPGRYDTIFLPPHKLHAPLGQSSPLAIVSQSGAFAAARLSSLDALAPRYVITIGNQIDLTIGDWVEHLERDPEVRVVACYVEGFRPGDGRRWLQAVQRLSAAGRQVVLYRAGRTAAGARASASHTAAIAGEYAVTRELAVNAGVLVADTLEMFEDLVRLGCALDGRDEIGARTAVLSNAGFECVAAADGLGPLRLAEPGRATREALGSLLARAGLAQIVGVANPLDVTPMADDDTFVAAARALLDDPAVDLAIVGCVPLTPALQTLPASADHDECLDDPGSIASRLVRLWDETRTPWVTVIDGGAPYDALANRLSSAGLPVFRRIDRALAVLGRRLEALRLSG